ncbi:SMEK domain-containing protein [Dyadobacter sp. CY261]|nr:SMEK domain-containing protein [Dyadobacter sp. CY261]
MTPEETLNKIKDKLDHWQIKLIDRQGDDDYYKLSENLLIKLLNPILDCNLINPNRENSRFPAVDLIDKEKRIAIQVTAEDTIGKIKETIESFRIHHKDDYDVLYIFQLKGIGKRKYSQEAIDKATQGELNFRAAEHIIDIRYLCSKMNFLSKDITVLNLILEHLSSLLPYKDKGHDYTILEQFINTTYRSEEFLNRKIDFNSLENYSDFFSHIISVTSFHKHEAAVNIDENIFLYLVRSILSSESDNPLTVCGIQGSGKSSFLNVLYEALCLLAEDQIPVYIDIQKYFTDADHADKIFEKLDHDLDKIVGFVERTKHSESILIIDGADDSFSANRELNQMMLERIKKRFDGRKKVIGLNIKDNVFAPPDSEKEKGLFIREGEIEIILNSISTYSTSFELFIDLYTETKGLRSRKTNPQHLKQYLIKQVKKFGIHRVDLFTLDILSEKVHVNEFTRCGSLSEFFMKYCVSKLKRTSLSATAKQAFDFYINKSMQLDDDVDSKELLFMHPSIRDFLLAYIIIERLKNGNIKKEELEFVYTDNINNFCKEIMNSSASTQQDIYKAISELFNDVGYKAKAHFCYLLGRFGAPLIKDEGKNFLTEQLTREKLAIDEAIATGKLAKNRSEFKEKLLYFRSLYISIIYCCEYGSSELDMANEQYLSILMKNGLWDSINRGFHMEYYGDLPFDPATGPLQKEDDLKKDFSYTYTKLYNKIEDAIRNNIGYSLIEIDVYTLCSLAQHRQISKLGNLDSEKRVSIVMLGNAILRSKLISRNLQKYVSFIAEILAMGDKISFGTFLAEIANLKKYPRTGWIERDIRNPEVIAAHMYNMWAMGYFCLPKESIEPDYDKDKILKMVLLHDIGEASTMDKSKKKKTKFDEEKEEKVIRKYGFLNTYRHNGIDEIPGYFHDFEDQNNDDINSKIARDLDKLDNLQQLYYYHYVEKVSIPDFATWEEELIDNIDTIEGRIILEYIQRDIEIKTELELEVTD